MKYLVSVLLAFVLAACAAGPAWEEPVASEPATDASFAVPDENVQEYTLGAGDKLRVIVFGETDLSGEFLVDGTGLVSMPLIGEVPAEGKTVRELQRAIEVALKDGYLNDPKVSAEVLNFRPFYILGEVNTPGTYPYSDELTVLNAVAVAGGFTYRANQKIIFIRREGEDVESRYSLTSTTRVRPGDTIRVAERIF